MSIQTTEYITREDAIARIAKVIRLIDKKDFLGVKECSYESGENLREFVEDFPYLFDPAELTGWTNEMLEEYMDMPFIRCSMFANYLIKEASNG